MVNYKILIELTQLELIQQKIIIQLFVISNISFFPDQGFKCTIFVSFFLSYQGNVHNHVIMFELW